MKFALRDDDLNFYFEPHDIERWYKDIWNICPISMSVVPFIMGDWKKYVYEIEALGVNNLDFEYFEKLSLDNKIYPIHNNLELVEFINDKIFENKIYLTLHGIHHRNSNFKNININNNYPFGAEFYTNEDLTNEVNNAIKYLEKHFNQKIEVFTPPQNKYTITGLNSVINNGLAVCGDLLSVKDVNLLKLLGVKNYLRYLAYKLIYRDSNYPYPIVSKKLKFINHYRLQPNTKLEQLLNDFNKVHEKNGIFVLSTHSYAFDLKMKYHNSSMNNALYDIIDYALKKQDVEFVKINNVFQ